MIRVDWNLGEKTWGKKSDNWGGCRVSALCPSWVAWPPHCPSYYLDLKTHGGEKSNKCNQCNYASSYASCDRCLLNINLLKWPLHLDIDAMDIYYSVDSTLAKLSTLATFSDPHRATSGLMNDWNQSTEINFVILSSTKTQPLRLERLKSNWFWNIKYQKVENKLEILSS